MKKEKAAQDSQARNTPVPAGQNEAKERELSMTDMESVSGGTEVIPPEWIMKDE